MQIANATSRRTGAILILGVGLLMPNWAVAVTGSDSTFIGKHPLYDTSYSAFWRQVGGTASDYSVLTNGTNTYVNAPVANGNIYFLGQNATRLTIGNGTTYGTCNSIGMPPGETKPICLFLNVTDSREESYGIGVRHPAGTAIQGATESDVGVLGSAGTGSGIEGYSDTGWGVYGHTNNGGIGVYGVSAGIAVKGQSSSTTFSAVMGANSSNSGYGVAGYTNGTGTSIYGINYATGYGVYGYNQAGGFAGYFVGNLNLTQGTATKPNGGMWSAPASDARTKKDVRPFKEGLAEVLDVRPVRYRFNGLAGTQDDGTEYVGVIAQQLEKISPSMVTSRKAKLHNDDAYETDVKGVDPSAFTYMLINAVKEQHQLILRQEARISALEESRAPILSSFPSGSAVYAGFAFGLVPLGIVATIRQRRKRTNSSAVT